MTADFVDYDSLEYQTWLSTLVPDDRSLMGKMTLEQLGALNDKQLERRKELRAKYLKERARKIRSQAKTESTASEDPQSGPLEESNVIATVDIETGDKGSRTLILTNTAFYMREKRVTKDGVETTDMTITQRPPILQKILHIEGKELLFVQYGRNQIIGNIKEITRTINDVIGGVSSNYYRTGISTILEEQRKNVKTEVAYPCVGVFVNPETKNLTVALPQHGNVFTIELKANGEANRVATEIAKRTLPNREKLKSTLTGYISLDRFMKPLEIIPTVGYAAAIPFTFELKVIEKQDYFCQVLLHGPKETGKSTAANLATDDLYGVLPKGIDYIDSKFRMLEILNEGVIPQHIAEMETFDFDEFADTIKNGTDIRDVGSRGNADQTQNTFFGKSTLFYSANSYKASKSAMLARMIMIPAPSTKEEIAPRHHLFNAFVKNRTKVYPIGYLLLEHTILDCPNIESIVKAINKVRNEIIYNVLRPEINIKLTDNRRSLTYALMLFGVRSWKKFVHSSYPKLAKPEYSELWFNKYSNVELFIEDIIRPLENVSTEVMQQNPTAVFIAWLESFISNQGEKEEGYTWMHAKKGGDYIYITAGVLQTYKKHCKQSGSAPFESLPQLATELTAYTGERCKENVYDIGRDEERDPDTGRIIKAAVPYKGRKAVKVPLSQQSKLTAVLHAE